MSRVNIEGARLADVYLERGFRQAAKIWVPVTAEQLTVNDPPLLIATPAGAINLRLPASSDATRGLTFTVVNTAAAGGAITMNTSGGAAFGTSIVIAAGETTTMFCTGSATANLGWQSIGTAAST